MHWIILYPSIQTGREPWLHDFVTDPAHTFDLLVAGYDHDRSRARTSARQWLDSLRHAWRGWRAARRAAAEGRAVGILCGFPPLTVCAGLLARLTGARWPIVGWSFNLGGTGGRLKRGLAAFALCRVDTMVVHARAEIGLYAEAFGLPRARFRFVPFAIEDQAPSLEEDVSRPFVVALGSAGRDYRALVDALRRLGLPGVIVSGAHAVEGLDLPPGVTARSGEPLAACHALAQRARVSVVPLANTVTASGQVTVIEAMLLGRCVVATRTVGTEDYVEDGVTGLLVPPGDVDALAAAIQGVWDDPARRAAIGRAARDQVRATAIYPVIGQAMGVLLTETAAGRPGRSTARSAQPRARKSGWPGARG